MILVAPQLVQAYLAKELAPYTDDEADLSVYVLAMMKKQVPVEELRQHMIEQLDAFLGDHTSSFVQQFFEYLSKERLIQDEPAVSTSDKHGHHHSETRQPDKREPSSPPHEHYLDRDGEQYVRRMRSRRDSPDEEDRDSRRRGRGSPEVR
jgi:hypothetical protein